MLLSQVQDVADLLRNYTASQNRPPAPIYIRDLFAGHRTRVIKAGSEVFCAQDNFTGTSLKYTAIIVSVAASSNKHPIIHGDRKWRAA